MARDRTDVHLRCRIRAVALKRIRISRWDSRMRAVRLICRTSAQCKVVVDILRDYLGSRAKAQCFMTTQLFRSFGNPVILMVGASRQLRYQIRMIKASSTPYIVLPRL